MIVDQHDANHELPVAGMKAAHLEPASLAAAHSTRPPRASKRSRIPMSPLPGCIVSVPRHHRSRE
jgi:hypothetical protein